MVKLSIAGGGGLPGGQNYNTHCSFFDSLCAEDEDKRITLPGLIMLPEEPKISYPRPSHRYLMSQMYLDYSPERERKNPYIFELIFSSALSRSP